MCRGTSIWIGDIKRHVQRRHFLVNLSFDIETERGKKKKGTALMLHYEFLARLRHFVDPPLWGKMVEIFYW